MLRLINAAFLVLNPADYYFAVGLFLALCLLYFRVLRFIASLIEPLSIGEPSHCFNNRIMLLNFLAISTSKQNNC